MPRWGFHSKSLAALSRRWNLNSQPSEFLTGIIPTVEVDKHWVADRLDIYGMLVQQPKDAVQTSIPACGLVAGSRELLVHRITCWPGTGAGGSLAGFYDEQGFAVHIFTPNSAYNPFALSPGVFFPWMQTRQGIDSIVSLPGAFGIGGEALTSQTITVNGVPVVTIGPTLRFNKIRLIGITPAMIAQTAQGFWTYQDPPLRIKPFQTLAVQFVNAQTVALFAGGTLNVNFWWSERDPQGDSG